MGDSGYGSKNILGNAATATALANARTINGVSFNGTANILLYPSGYYYQDQNWAAKTVSVAADRYKLLSPNIVDMDVAGTPLRITTQQTLDLSLEATWDTIVGTDYRTAGNRAGKDFYVYACDSSGTLVLKVSANASAPSGYTTADSRLLGGFHCLCVAVAHETTLTAWVADTVIAIGETRKATVWDGFIYRCTARAGDFKTHAATEPNWASIAVGATIVDDQITWIKEQHSLEGYLAGDILPASVWDLKKRPTSSSAGMVYNNTGEWVDIYLRSGTGANTASVYNATIVHGATYLNHCLDLQTVGKQLMRFNRLLIAAQGSNFQTPAAGGGAPTVTGGLSDSYGRRMISHIGMEDFTGNHSQFVSDIRPDAGPPAYATYCGMYWSGATTNYYFTAGISFQDTGQNTIAARGSAPSRVTM